MTDIRRFTHLYDAERFLERSAFVRRISHWFNPTTGERASIRTTARYYIVTISKDRDDE